MNTTTLRLIALLVWPSVVVLVIFLFRRAINEAFRSGRLKVKIFGVEIETTGEKLVDVVWKNFDYFEPSAHQWAFLVQLSRATKTGIGKADASKSGLDYRRDLRPLRNAGLIAGEASTLGQSKTLRITPLGEFVVRNAKSRS